MKRYFLAMLQEALNIWVTLAIGIISTSVLYAVLNVSGVPKNTSLLIAFLLLFGLIFFRLYILQPLRERIRKRVARVNLIDSLQKQVEPPDKEVEIPNNLAGSINIGQSHVSIAGGNIYNRSLNRHNKKKATGVTITAAMITASGAIVAAIVGALITGILYTTRPSSPTPTPSGTPSAACAAAPTLTGPADGQTLNSRTVTLAWEAPQGCLPDGYTVRLSAVYDPEAKPWIVDTGWAPTDYTYTFTADGTYYWHIRACQPCTPFHPGNWAIRSFTIHTKSPP